MAPLDQTDRLENRESPEIKAQRVLTERRARPGPPGQLESKDLWAKLDRLDLQETLALLDHKVRQDCKV